MQLVNHPNTGAGAVLEQFAPGEDLMRCITDYLAAGMPIIAPYSGVDEGSLSPRAALVLGMHMMRDPREASDGSATAALEALELPGRLVIHDSVAGPYSEKPTSELIQWMSEGQSPAPAILAIGPRGIRFGVRAVRSRTAIALETRRSVLEGYAANVPNINVNSAVRIVVRMLQSDQVFARHFSPADELCNGADRSRLAAWVRLKAWFEEICRADGGGPTLSQTSWWCAEVRLGDAALQQGPRLYPSPLVYLWPLQTPSLSAEENATHTAPPAAFSIEHTIGHEKSPFLARLSSPWLITQGCESEEFREIEFQTVPRHG